MSKLDKSDWEKWLREGGAVLEHGFWRWAGISLACRDDQWRVSSTDYGVDARGRLFASPEDAAAYILATREEENKRLQRVRVSAEALARAKARLAQEADDYRKRFGGDDDFPGVG